MSAVPGFGAWVDYCFTQAAADHAYLGPDDPAPDEKQDRGVRFVSLGDRLPAYLQRLFREAASLEQRFTDDQIAGGLWQIFGAGMECFKQLTTSERIDCYRLLPTFFADFLDKVCCQRGRYPDREFCGVCSHASYLPLDGAVYMLWDMDGGLCWPKPDAQRPDRGLPGGGLLVGRHGPDQSSDALAALQEILFRCRTSTCRISALHGLGHAHLRGHMVEVEQIVHRFLTEHTMPDWVRDHAHSARQGRVQ